MRPYYTRCAVICSFPKGHAVKCMLLITFDVCARHSLNWSPFRWSPSFHFQTMLWWTFLCLFLFTFLPVCPCIHGLDNFGSQTPLRTYWKLWITSLAKCTYGCGQKEVYSCEYVKHRVNKAIVIPTPCMSFPYKHLQTDFAHSCVHRHPLAVVFSCGSQTCILDSVVGLAKDP